MKNTIYVEGNCTDAGQIPIVSIDIIFNNTKVGTKTQVNNGKRV